MVCFAGQRGPAIARSLLEIEATFEKHLNILHSVKKGILDVKNTSWHDDYNKYVMSFFWTFLSVANIFLLCTVNGLCMLAVKPQLLKFD